MFKEDKNGRLMPKSFHPGCVRHAPTWLLSFALLLGACTSRPLAEKPKPEPPKGPTPYKLTFPLGLSPESAVIPKDNPLT